MTLSHLFQSFFLFVYWTRFPIGRIILSHWFRFNLLVSIKLVETVIKAFWKVIVMSVVPWGRGFVWFLMSEFLKCFGLSLNSLKHFAHSGRMIYVTIQWGRILRVITRERCHCFIGNIWGHAPPPLFLYRFGAGRLHCSVILSWIIMSHICINVLVCH